MPDDTFLSPADKALLARPLSTSDPSSLGGRRVIPRSPIVPPIRFNYDVNPPAGMERLRIWCGHCQKETHWKGYVIELDDGQLATLGHECGDKQFGFEFGAVANAFDAEADRYYYLGVILRLRSHLPEGRAVLKRLCSDASLTDFDRARSGLRDNWPEVWRGLKSVAQGSGQLLAVSERLNQLKTTAAEDAIRSNYDAKLATVTNPLRRANLVDERDLAVEALVPICDTLRSDHGFLAGGAFLTAAGSLLDQANAAETKLGQAVTTLSAPCSSDLPTRAMKAAVKDVRQSIEAARAVLALLDQAVLFWSASNIVAVAGWATAQIGGLRWSGRAGELSTHTGSSVAFKCKSLCEIREALDCFETSLGWG